MRRPSFAVEHLALDGTAHPSGEAACRHNARMSPEARAAALAALTTKTTTPVTQETP